MDNNSRKYVHQLCRARGLTSKSYGKGEDRFLVVRKHTHRIQQSLPMLSLSRDAEALVRSVRSSLPPPRSKPQHSASLGYVCWRLCVVMVVDKINMMIM